MRAWPIISARTRSSSRCPTTTTTIILTNAVALQTPFASTRTRMKKRLLAFKLVNAPLLGLDLRRMLGVHLVDDLLQLFITEPHVRRYLGQCTTLHT